MKYHKHESFDYVTLDQIRQEHGASDAQDFENYMRGKTVPCIPNVKGPVYVWDYERFFSKEIAERSGDCVVICDRGLE